MKEITLDGLTDEQLQAEAQLLISMIRAKYPRLDLRRGTVLRDLLIDADAAVGAWFAAQADEQRLSSSLLTLSERAAAGEELDQTDVNAALSNFNMKSVSGTKAKGYVKVLVSSGDVRHTVLSGVQFKTVDDLYFTVTQDITAATKPVAGEVLQTETLTGSFWYLVPVEAAEVGARGNLAQGLALEPTMALADFLSASAYSTFSGGSDLEELDKTIDRIKPSLSVRNLTSKTAVEAQLRDRYDDSENPIVAVSVCGYGNSAQRRDKHNLFGTAVGGRADIYVRNFTDLPVSENSSMFGVIEEGSFTAFDDSNDGIVGTASFTIPIHHAAVKGAVNGDSPIPGAIFVYSVSDPDSSALASYRFETTYSGDVTDVWHDFLTNEENVPELANTVWRDLTLKVFDVPVTEDEKEEGQKRFRVTVVALPAAQDMQDYVDDGLVRNVAADYVVRGPMLVNMSVNAVVRYRYATGFDVDKAKAEICKYVNSTGFQGRMTRSEISAILMNLGASSVDLFDENEMLYGYVYDAAGNKYELTGDALDIDVVANPKNMLTVDTAVFVIEPKNIQITTVAV